MKSRLRRVHNRGKVYDALMFVCPGCVAGVKEGSNYEGLHMLPVNSQTVKPSWDFDGNLEAPTLSPSILTHQTPVHPRCHSFLRGGVFEFLQDSTHPLAGQHVPIPDLPEWAVELL